MQIKIDSVSDVKTDSRGTSSKITSGNVNYFVNEDATPHIGKMVEITSEERTSKAGNKYNVAKIVNVLGEAHGGNSGGVPWADYKQMAELAHSTALALEPDYVDQAAGGITVDRSQARARIINTCLIAFTNGKIFIPEDEIPF